MRVWKAWEGEFRIVQNLTISATGFAASSSYIQTEIDPSLWLEYHVLQKFRVKEQYWICFFRRISVLLTPCPLTGVAIAVPHGILKIRTEEFGNGGEQSKNAKRY